MHTGTTYIQYFLGHPTGCFFYLEQNSFVWLLVCQQYVRNCFSRFSTLTLLSSARAFAHAKSVRGTSEVLCFGHRQPRISSLHLTSLWRHELLQILRLGQSLFEGCHSLHDQFQSATSPSHLSAQEYAWKQMSVTPPLTLSSFSSWGVGRGGGAFAYRLSLCLCVCPPIPASHHRDLHPPIADPALHTIRCTLPWCCFFYKRGPVFTFVFTSSWTMLL